MLGCDAGRGKEIFITLEAILKISRKLSKKLFEIRVPTIPRSVSRLIDEKNPRLCTVSLIMKHNYPIRLANCEVKAPPKCAALAIHGSSHIADKRKFSQVAEAIPNCGTQWTPENRHVFQPSYCDRNAHSRNLTVTYTTKLSDMHGVLSICTDVWYGTSLRNQWLANMAYVHAVINNRERRHPFIPLLILMSNPNF